MNLLPKTRIIIELIALLLVLSVSWGRDKNAVTYKLATGSRLWIDGEATLGSYECSTVAVYGAGDVDTSNIREKHFSGNKSSINKSALLEVIVRFFDCGNPAMNADMYSALRADKDSVIQYRLLRTSVLYDSSQYNGRLGLRTVGRLTIAGVTQLDTIDVDVKILQDKKYEIIGHKNLSMIDYKIIPPTAFFGLIKADENLTVQFDLIAAPKDDYDPDKVGELIESLQKPK